MAIDQEWTSVYPTSLDGTSQMPDLGDHTHNTRWSQWQALRNAVKELEAQVGSDLLETGSLRKVVGDLSAPLLVEATHVHNNTGSGSSVTEVTELALAVTTTKNNELVQLNFVGLASATPSLPDSVVPYTHGATIVTGAYQCSEYDPVNSRIYLVPFQQGNQANWHYIDLATGKVIAYTARSAVAMAYVGGVYDPVNSRIWFVPCVQAPQTNWHYINLATGAATAYAHGVSAVSGAYTGGVYDPVNSRIWFVPASQANQTNWHYVNLATGTIVAYAHGATAVSGTYCNGVYDPVNSRIWFVPSAQANQTNWHYIDLATRTVVAYAHGATAVSGAYAGGVYDPVNSRIWLMPYSQAAQPNWHYIDLATRTVVAYASGTTAVAEAYNGNGVYDSIRERIYFSPFRQFTKPYSHYVDLATCQVVAYAHGVTPIDYGSVGATYDPVRGRIYFAPYWIRNEWEYLSVPHTGRIWYKLDSESWVPVSGFNSNWQQETTFSFNLAIASAGAHTVKLGLSSTCPGGSWILRGTTITSRFQLVRGI